MTLIRPNMKIKLKEILYDERLGGEITEAPTWAWESVRVL